MATATAGRSGGGALPPLSDPSSARRGPAHLVTYLDSHVAHTALTEYRDDILADVESAGLHASLADSGAWVLPVFVFDLDNALTGAGSAAGADPSARLGAPLPVLLDEYEQAVAYPDMVIAVRSQVRKYDVPWVCDERRVTIDLDNLTKPLLGAVAKTAFHLADTYAYWSDATGPNANHLWSVGQGPFTPLSGQAGLPTVVADLGARNLALLHYNRSLSRVLGVVNGLRRLAKGDPKRRPQDVLPVAQLPVFRGRLAAFEFKAAQMAAALEGGRYKAAAHYAASTMHEASALVSLAQHVDATLEMGLECGGAGGAAAAAAGVPWELWLTPVVAVAMLVGAIVHRATAVPKRKEM